MKQNVNNDVSKHFVIGTFRTKMSNLKPDKLLEPFLFMSLTSKEEDTRNEIVVTDDNLKHVGLKSCTYSHIRTLI